MVTAPTDAADAATKAYTDSAASPGTGRNALTGMWHVDGYGAKGDGTTQTCPASKHHPELTSGSFGLLGRDFLSSSLPQLTATLECEAVSLWAARQLLGL